MWRVAFAATLVLPFIFFRSNQTIGHNECKAAHRSRNIYVSHCIGVQDKDVQMEDDVLSDVVPSNIVSRQQSEGVESEYVEEIPSDVDELQSEDGGDDKVRLTSVAAREAHLLTRLSATICRERALAQLPHRNWRKHKLRKSVSRRSRSAKWQRGSCR